MSEKLNDSKIEEVAGGYEAPAAQTGNETEPETGILAVPVIVTISVNSTVAPLVMSVVQPQPMNMPTVNVSVTASPWDTPSGLTEDKK